MATFFPFRNFIKVDYFFSSLDSISNICVSCVWSSAKTTNWEKNQVNRFVWSYNELSHRIKYIGNEKTHTERIIRTSGIIKTSSRYTYIDVALLVHISQLNCARQRLNEKINRMKNVCLQVAARAIKRQVETEWQVVSAQRLTIIPTLAFIYFFSWCFFSLFSAVHINRRHITLHRRCLHKISIKTWLWYGMLLELNTI